MGWMVKRIFLDIDSEKRKRLFVWWVLGKPPDELWNWDGRENLSLLEELKERSSVGFPPTLSHYLKRRKPETTCTAEILRKLPWWLGRSGGGINLIWFFLVCTGNWAHVMAEGKAYGELSSIPDVIPLKLLSREIHPWNAWSSSRTLGQLLGDQPLSKILNSCCP